MVTLYGEQDAKKRQSSCLGLSVFLHALILILMCFNFSWNTSEFEASPPAILMIDLTKVEISDKTNLPPLVKEKKEEAKKEEPKKEEPKKEEPKPTPKKEEPKKEEPKPAPKKEEAKHAFKENKTPLVKKEVVPQKTEPVKPKETPKKEAVKAIEPKKDEKKKVEPKKEVKKEKPKKPAKPKPKNEPKVAPKPIPKKQNQGLQSLLASVEKVRKPANSAPKKSAQSEPTSQSSAHEVNKGIKGGTEGSLLSDLTISEKDLIASKISSCWNVNAGVKDADKMIVELRAFLNKDGSVREVKILNMKNDPLFKSMAESARRAIFVCDALGAESPFRILAEKRANMYQSWKEIYLRMNPVDGGVY